MNVSSLAHICLCFGPSYSPFSHIPCDRHFEGLSALPSLGAPVSVDEVLRLGVAGSTLSFCGPCLLHALRRACLLAYFSIFFSSSHRLISFAPWSGVDAFLLSGQVSVLVPWLRSFSDFRTGTTMSIVTLFSTPSLLMTTEDD